MESGEGVDSCPAFRAGRDPEPIPVILGSARSSNAKIKAAETRLSFGLHVAVLIGVTCSAARPRVTSRSCNLELRRDVLVSGL